MSYIAYIMFEGIIGPCIAAGHYGEIELLSYSFGHQNHINTIGSATGGGGSGKTDIKEMTISKSTDIASHALWSAANSGDEIPTAVLLAESVTGSKSNPYLKYEMKNVSIDSVQVGHSSGGDDRPAEIIGISFSSIKLTVLTK